MEPKIETVYVARGIPPASMERLVEEINKHKERVRQGILRNPGQLVLVGEYPQTVTKITRTDSQELSLADFFRELVFDSEEPTRSLSNDYEQD